MSKATLVLSPHLPPPFNLCLLQILRFLSRLRRPAAVPVGFCCAIIRIILQKDGQPSGEPVHVSTQPGLRIPEQFCLQTHSGTFNVLLLGLQRKLKTFFSLGFSRHTDKRFFFFFFSSDIFQGGLGCSCHICQCQNEIY